MQWTASYRTRSERNTRTFQTRRRHNCWNYNMNTAEQQGDTSVFLMRAHLLWGARLLLRDYKCWKTTQQFYLFHYLFLFICGFLFLFIYAFYWFICGFSYIYFICALFWSYLIIFIVHLFIYFFPCKIRQLRQTIPHKIVSEILEGVIKKNTRVAVIFCPTTVILALLQCKYALTVNDRLLSVYFWALLNWILKAPLQLYLPFSLSTASSSMGLSPSVDHGKLISICFTAISHKSSTAAAVPAYWARLLRCQLSLSCQPALARHALVGFFHRLHPNSQLCCCGRVFQPPCCLLCPYPPLECVIFHTLSLS